MIRTLLFLIFSLNIIISSLFVVFSINPIHSILFLIFAFVNGAAVLLSLHVEFISILFIVVYVGAIAVLFLFAVMLLNLRITEFNENLIRYVPIGLVLLFAFLYQMSIIVNYNSTIIDIVDEYNFTTWINNIFEITNIKLIGQILYTDYFILFIIISMILLLVMVGAIVLTLRERTDISKRQDTFKQVDRSKNIRLISF
jgi:NADH:ubiquinone oxidoreductase subunit 6 (subunit J)